MNVAVADGMLPMFARRTNARHATSASVRRRVKCSAVSTGGKGRRGAVCGTAGARVRAPRNAKVLCMCAQRLRTESIEGGISKRFMIGEERER